MIKNAFYLGWVLGLVLLTFSCQSPSKNKEKQAQALEIVKDNHSFAQPWLARTTHLSLDLVVNFDSSVIKGVATHTISTSNDAKEFVVDVKHLDIEKVVLDEGEEAEFSISEPQEHLGSALTIAIEPTTKSVSIYYSTTANTEAVQWLAPGQTAGKQHPFLFTQGEAILTRTWIPLQDSPGIKLSYDAKVQVPKGMMALMSAINPQKVSADGVYHFEQKNPVVPYLIALAVGNLEFGSMGERTGVYAEPVTLDKALHEFADTEKMVVAAEELYGPYAWERYDLLVLPPSFPFGGMENPVLTFATPTIIAGDRSLTTLVAHELAHSWSGNLVTNATWDDFWLNEGFTVYFERRIMEKIYGSDYADMLQLLGYEELQATMAELGENSEDTKLKLDLAGRNPDDGMNDIAYEKGYFFLKHLEMVTGREQFDNFLREYFTHYAFKSITTETFVEYMNEKLLLNRKGLIEKAWVQQWVYTPGLPVVLKRPTSSRLEAVEATIEKFANSKDVGQVKPAKWSAHEWVHFLRGLQGKVNDQALMSLDRAFKLTESNNSEVKFAWLMLAVEANYMPAMPAMEEFLIHTGRRKFLTPLYKSLLEKPNGKLTAERIYRQARPNYHFVARNTMDALLNYEG